MCFCWVCLLEANGTQGGGNSMAVLSFLWKLCQWEGHINNTNETKLRATVWKAKSAQGSLKKKNTHTPSHLQKKNTHTRASDEKLFSQTALSTKIICYLDRDLWGVIWHCSSFKPLRSGLLRIRSGFQIIHQIKYPISWTKLEKKKRGGRVKESTYELNIQILMNLNFSACRFVRHHPCS